MVQKTIPALNPITSINKDALFPIDTGTQSFKITAQNVANSLAELSKGYAAEMLKMLSVPMNIWSGQKPGTLPDRNLGILASAGSHDLKALFIMDGGAAAGSIYTSTDGVNWTSRTPPANGWWVSACAGLTSTFQPLLCVFGYQIGTASVYTSNDGDTWTARTLPAAGKIYSQLAYGSKSIFSFANATMIVGTVDGFIYRSINDGITWSAITKPSSLTNVRTVNFFGGTPFVGSEFFLISGTDTTSGTVGKLWKTTDFGATLTAVSTVGIPAGCVIEKIVHNGVDTFCAMINDDDKIGLDPLKYRMFTSPDAITWTESTNFLEAAGPDISRNESQIVRPMLLTSKYEVSNTSPAPTTRPGVFMARSQSGLMVSRDGKFWVQTNVWGPRYGFSDQSPEMSDKWVVDRGLNRLFCMAEGTGHPADRRMIISKPLPFVL